ncbi:hypothetical protein FRC06_003552 [Ceratobasidium sp. 370]|nr:hypothetical protein FRC06_003552 [Ceratobasidium sp. 370]
MSEYTETPLPPSPVQNADETTTTTIIVEPQTPRPPSPAVSVAETTRAGPSRNGRGTSYQAPDQASINNLVNGFTTTLESLDQSLKMLMTNAKEVEALGPPPDPAAQIHKLRLQLRAQDKKQDQRIADIKHIVKDVLKEQASQPQIVQKTVSPTPHAHV